MKKTLFIKISLVIILYFVGCKDILLDNYLYKLAKNKSNTCFSLDLASLIKSIELDGWKTDTVPSEKRLDSEALHYYKNVEKAIFATNSHQQLTQNNPFKEELNNLIIKTANNNYISFFCLSEDQKKIFLNNWVAIQAKQLGEKMKIAPEGRDELQFEDEALQTVLNTQTYKNFKNGLEVLSNTSFFSALENKKEKLVENELNTKNHFNKSGSFFCQREISLNNKGGKTSNFFIKARDTLVRYSTAGKLLLRLPINGNPYVVTNLSFKDWGHVSILTCKVTRDDDENTNISISANRHDEFNNKLEEVRKEKLKEWDSTYYIIGLQEVEYQLCYTSISGVMTEILLKKTKPITNLSKIASEACKYLGRPYASTYKNFMKAANIAPNEFTCTTLAWWCIKKMFGFEIRNNKSKMITPGEIYRNSHVYVLSVIKQ